MRHKKGENKEAQAYREYANGAHEVAADAGIRRGALVPRESFALFLSPGWKIA
jgi:hypothetical protein